MITPKGPRDFINPGPHGCVAQLVEQRSPKPPVGGSNPSALDHVTFVESIMGSEQVQRMDVKKSRSTASSKVAGQKVVAFVGDVKQELKKVEWTNKDELKSYTKIVLVSTLIFGMFIYFIDLIIQGFLEGINLLVKFF